MSNIVTLSGAARARVLPIAIDRLPGVFARQRHAQDDARWLKENAEVLRLLVATGQRPDPAALAAAYGDFAADLPARLAFFPQYYRFYLSIALDLRDLGLPGVEAGRLVARAMADGLPDAELSDLQRAEARLLAQRAGVTVLRDAGLTERLLGFAARSATFALPNKKAAYELTHIAFYLSDYGRHGFAGAETLQESLEFVGIVAWLEQNTDLLAEVCLALHYCGAAPPALWQAGVTRDLAGFYIGSIEGAAGNDDYHAWLMAAWADCAAGGTPLQRGVPAGPLGFVAPPAASALAEISGALLRMEGARGGDWPLMRRRLLPVLSRPALDLLDAAAEAIPSFERFFARFARTVPQGAAA